MDLPCAPALPTHMAKHSFFFLFYDLPCAPALPTHMAKQIKYNPSTLVKITQFQEYM